VSEDGVVKLADFNSSRLLSDLSWSGDVSAAVAPFQTSRRNVLYV
jgi:hypothetical protein